MQYGPNIFKSYVKACNFCGTLVCRCTQFGKPWCAVSVNCWVCQPSQIQYVGFIPYRRRKMTLRNNWKHFTVKKTSP